MSDLRVLERWLASPPQRLRDLEALVGPLDVDWNVAPSGLVSRELHRAGVHSLSASFFVSHYYEPEERRQDKSLRSLAVAFGAAPDEVVRVFEARFGAGRRVSEPGTRIGDVVIEDHAWLEYGEWFYVALDHAYVWWTSVRPEWAHPPVPMASRQDFLATFVDRLATESEAERVMEALAPLAAANGVDLGSASRSARAPMQPSLAGFTLIFRPAIDTALVMAALRWEEPIGVPNRWIGRTTVKPRAQLSPNRVPRFGAWEVTVELDTTPALPDVGTEHSPLYDLSAGPTVTRLICVYPVED